MVSPRPPRRLRWAWRPPVVNFGRAHGWHAEVLATRRNCDVKIVPTRRKPLTLAYEMRIRAQGARVSTQWCFTRRTFARSHRPRPLKWQDSEPMPAAMALSVKVASRTAHPIASFAWDQALVLGPQTTRWKLKLARRTAGLGIVWECQTFRQEMHRESMPGSMTGFEEEGAQAKLWAVRSGPRSWAQTGWLCGG